MPLTENQKEEIDQLISSKIKAKSTSLGMSIYEDVSVIIAKPHCDECFREYSVGGVISKGQEEVIKTIIRELGNKKRQPNIQKEIQAVLKANRKNANAQKSGKIADFYMKKKGKEFYFEIKTVKPNIDVFKESKTKLLEWTARRRKKIYLYLAFPYNPYHPEPYNRFTEANFVKINKDFLVGEKYWDFLGGKNTFRQLLNVFDTVGKRYKKCLIKKFKEVAREKIDSY